MCFLLHCRWVLFVLILFECSVHTCSVSVIAVVTAAAMFFISWLTFNIYSTCRESMWLVADDNDVVFAFAMAGTCDANGTYFPECGIENGFVGFISEMNSFWLDFVILHKL